MESPTTTPTPSNSTTDRRQRRSDDPNQALGYQLDQVVDDFNLRGCVLVGQDGETIAASPSPASDELQQLARLLPTMSVEKSAKWDQDECSTCVFRAGGRRYFIGALGPEAVMNEVAIFRAIIGARRISDEG